MDGEVGPDDAFHRRGLETCRPIGVEPLRAECVRALVGGWNRRLANGESVATTLP